MARPGLPDQYRIGRLLFRSTAPMRGIRDPAGVWHDISEHQAVDDILWQSRQCVWGTTPVLPPAHEPILRAYFQSRNLQLPDAPTPSWNRIAGAVLQPGGSAPGVDGEPYEVYYYGV